MSVIGFTMKALPEMMVESLSLKSLAEQIPTPQEQLDNAARIYESQVTNVTKSILNDIVQAMKTHHKRDVEYTGRLFVNEMANHWDEIFYRINSLMYERGWVLTSQNLSGGKRLKWDPK